MEWKQIVLGDRKVMKFYCQDATHIVLLQGSAEIDGAELSLSKPLDFIEGDHGIIFTFSGCNFQYHGDLKFYISNFTEENEIPNICVNIHSCLEILRQHVNGPRIMICGNNGYGKTRFCRILVNYKLRSLKQILYIDAEIYYSDLSIPGSISAMVVTQPYDVRNGWNISDDIVTFNFGNLSGIDDPELYILQLRTLSDLVDKRLHNDPELSKSGFILNMDSFDKGDTSLIVKEQKASIIRKCAQQFKIDYIIVLEDGFMEQLIRKDLNRRTVVFRVPMPVQRINSYEGEDQMIGKVLSMYFTGQGDIKIQLRSFVLFNNRFHIYRIQKKGPAQINHLKDPIEMKMSRKFIYSFLGVSQAKRPEDISSMPIYGYVMVIDIINDETLKILSPASEKLPTNILLYTGVKSKYFS